MLFLQSYIFNNCMREIQFREAVCEAMSEEMRKDSSIYLMGEKLPSITVLTKHPKEC